jgi:lysine-specific demethylase/histidyl-hydroxylase NO66
VPGFNRHGDWMDVIAQQLVGKKRWQVFRPGDSTPYVDTILSAGEAIYVPKGWLHEVTPVGVESLHVTTSAIAPTVYDLMRFLIAKQSRSALTGPWAVDVRDVEALREALRTIIDSIHDGAFAEQFPTSTPVFY